MSAPLDPPSAVVFDVDGTLVDSTYLHALAWSRAFRSSGLEVATAEIHRQIGKASDDLVAALVGGARDDVVDAHAGAFAELRDEVRAFPRSAELLAGVRALGLRVVLASSARPDDHEANLAAIGGDHLVDGSLDAGSVDATKPEPDPFLRAASSVGAAPERSVVVGDAVWDMIAAGRAGMVAVGVECGGVSAAELREAGATAVYRDPGDLLDHLAGSPIGRLASQDRGDAASLAARGEPGAGALDGADGLDAVPEPSEPG